MGSVAFIVQGLRLSLSLSPRRAFVCVVLSVKWGRRQKRAQKLESAVFFFVGGGLDILEVVIIQKGRCKFMCQFCPLHI